MRLLPERDDHGGGGAAPGESQDERCRHRRPHQPHLALPGPSASSRRGLRTPNDCVRRGGAAARMMLIEAAANEWKVPVQECTAANGVITHKASNRTTTYGKVAQAASKMEPPKDVPLKDPKDWKVIGK